MEPILSATGQPFSDKTAAEVKARTLTAELGEEYAVVSHPAGGYAIAKNNGEAISGHAGPAATAAPPFETIHLRPAWRSFWEQHLLLLAGAIAALAPRSLLSTVLTSLLNVDPDYTERVASSGVLPFLSLIGAVAMIVALGKILNGYYSNSYQIGPDMIETVHGIAARKTQRIEYRHIRSVNINQSVIDRLLIVGTIEISTAAREGGDLFFYSVSKPKDIQEEIFRRKLAQPRRQEDE
jgi:membrane protein YdbS with pleckstrin-like domain